MSLPFPDIDPILVQIGPLAVSWYGISYVIGIMLGWYYIALVNKRPPKALPQEAYDNLVVWAIFGIILGGRMGYVLFYNLSFYIDNPMAILKTWEGGMSFHGGLLGVIISMYMMCRVYKLKFFEVMDLAACATPIGLFFGRIANFINGELYGRTSDVPWSMVFPGDPFLRHPSQLYEALLEGVALFIILAVIAFKTNALQKRGTISGAFLIGYGVFRSFVELFREPDQHIGFIFSYVTMGQILCIPMIAIGLYLVLRKKC